MLRSNKEEAMIKKEKPKWSLSIPHKDGTLPTQRQVPMAPGELPICHAVVPPERNRFHPEWKPGQRECEHGGEVWTPPAVKP